MLLFPCIYLVFFGGIWAFQRVMTNPNQFFLARLAGGPLCATALAVLVAPAREPLLTLSFMREPFYSRFRPSGSFCLKIYHSVPLSGPGAHRRPAFVIYRGLDGASQRLEAVTSSTSARTMTQVVGVAAAIAGDPLGPWGPWIAHPRPIRHALTRAKRIGQPTARARTKSGSLVYGATRRRNKKTAAAASQTKSRVFHIPERRLNLVWSSSVLIAGLQHSAPTIGIARFRPPAD
jgi:hypothetical protein